MVELSPIEDGTFLGGHLLCEGRCDEALAAFERARKAYSERVAVTWLSIHLQSEEPAPILLTRIPGSTLRVQFMPHPNHDYGNPYAGDLFPFPIAFRSRNVFDIASTPYLSELNDCQLFRCAGTCLFSIALCHHLREDPTDQSVEKALALYHQAWACLNECSIDPEDTSIVVYMAVCMNIAACAQRLGQLNVARLWTLYLSDILRALPPEENGQSTAAISHELRHFFHVSTVLDGRSISAASA